MKKTDEIHIYDWLETKKEDESEEKLRELLDFQTRPAFWQYENKEKKPEHKCFCEYNGKKYRIIGASRLGDIWLTKHFDKDKGYDKRVMINECSNFSHGD